MTANIDEIDARLKKIEEKMAEARFTRLLKYIKLHRPDILALVALLISIFGAISVSLQG